MAIFASKILFLFLKIIPKVSLIKHFFEHKPMFKYDYVDMPADRLTSWVVSAVGNLHFREWVT